MSNEAGKTLKEAPKVGDRVTLPADYKGGGAWFLWLAGTSGRVTELEGSDATVKFDDGTEDYGKWRYLRPETPTAPDQAAPTHIVIEGVRYALTPEPEEKKKPEVGEIWRDSEGKLVFIARVGRANAQAVKLHKAEAHRYWGDPVGFKDGAMVGHSMSNWTLAYPSLAAAIKAGETFE